MQTDTINKKSRVALVRCENYDEHLVHAAVARGIDLLGGVAVFFTPNERIVLKPNVLVGVHPDHAATTHPAVMGGVIKQLKEFGCKLSYGDSPGFGKPLQAMKTVCLAQIAEKYKVPLADFERMKKVSHPDGCFKKSFPLVSGVVDADGMVSISKFKTHGLMRFTGAVKNQYGCIAGLQKTRYHAEIPFLPDFSQFIVDITTCIKPRLYIIDAVVAMEGNGPNSGDPKKLGCLLLSTDPVACDAIACRIIALNPEHVPTCKAGYRSGLGTYFEHEIEIVGDQLSSFIDTSFKVVRKPAVSIYGTGIAATIKSFILPRPVIEETLCSKCGRCIEVCPVNPKAVAWKDNENKDSPPVYTYTRCIRCFCCQETCPSNAIVIKTSSFGWLLPLISVGGIIVSGFRFVRRQIRRRFSFVKKTDIH